MQVQINDCPVDFELGRDKKISDVINSISEWTRERDLVFYELYIDENRHAADTAPDKNIDEVSVINFIIQSKADLVFSAVDEASRSCERVASFISRLLNAGECRQQDTDDLRTGMTWILEVIEKIITLLGIDHDRIKYKDRTLSEHMRAIESLRDNLAGAADGAAARGIISAHAEMFSDTKQIFRMLLLSDEMRSLIVQSIDSPDTLLSSLRQIKDGLGGQLANIQAAAVAFQIGKDTEGSERLKEFVDYIYRYTRTCYQIVPMFNIDLAHIQVGGESLENKNRDLRALLHEVTTIMENNDIISLSDILEYELRPALENLGEYLDELMKAISAS